MFIFQSIDGLLDKKLVVFSLLVIFGVLCQWSDLKSLQFLGGFTGVVGIQFAVLELRSGRVWGEGIIGESLVAATPSNRRPARSLEDFRRAGARWGLLARVIMVGVIILTGYLWQKREMARLEFEIRTIEQEVNDLRGKLGREQGQE